MKFEINLIFLIKPLCSMTKNSRQKLKYVKNEKNFWGEIKSIFHHFYRAFNCQKLSQTWECTFKISRKFNGKHLCRILLFNKDAAAKFTGSKTNIVVHNPVWVVALWNFVSLLYMGIGIYTNSYPDLLGLPGISHFHRPDQENATRFLEI